MCLSSSAEQVWRSFTSCGLVDHMISSVGYTLTPELMDCRTLICGLYEKKKEKKREQIQFYIRCFSVASINDDEIAWTILIGSLRKTKNKGPAEEFSQLFQATLISGCHNTMHINMINLWELYAKCQKIFLCSF